MTDKHKESLNRHFVLVVLFLVCSIITIKNNVHIDDPGDMSNLQFWIVLLFKFSPVIVLSSLEGVIPGIGCCYLLFIAKTFVNRELAFTTAIYIIGAQFGHYFSMIGMYKKKRTTFFVMIFFMFLYGSLWGGILGLVAGRGFTEFMPARSLYYFLNELPEAFIATGIVYIFFNQTPNNFKKLFFSGVYYRDDVDELTRKMADIRKSKLSMAVSTIIAFQAVVLGIFAAVFANTLIPQISSEYIVSTEMVEQMTDSIDWSEVKNTVALEKEVSRIEEVRNVDDIGFKFDNQTLIFDVKLIMLILIVVIPMTVVTNQIAQMRLAQPIQKLSDTIQAFYDQGLTGLDQNLERLERLNIRTDDEIEYLYRGYLKTAETMVGYIKMIQAQRSLADELRAEQMANEAKNNFLSSMSHEIRTPINAILGFNEMILRESKEPETLKYAGNVSNSGKLLLGLVNDILDFSRIEAGKIEIIPVEYDLSSLVNDLINTTKVRMKGRNLELKTRISSDIPCILLGDEIRIKQCAMNILTNAIKYTPEGQVTLTIDHKKIDDENVMLKIRVKDTGIGIRKEDMDKLFSPFERIEENRNRTIEGTGLGMNIVKQLLALMDSRLLVSSEYGKGSEFSFGVKQKVLNWEPIGDFAATYEETLMGQNTYHESFHAPDAKILVVDDTLANLTVMQGLLKPTQIKVDIAESGYEALDAVCENKYDLIFLDHRMPKFDGIQTFRAMKELEDNINKDVPVFALTANVISGAREMYLNEGFAGYLPKPVDSARLEDLIIKNLPDYKVIRSGEDGFDDAETVEEITGDDLKAIDIMANMEGIEFEAGVKNCGSPAALMNVARDFVLAIDSKSKSIKDAWEFKDYENYTTYVHGLKSSARVIGAMELSNLAAYLEQCGNRKDDHEIERRTPELLDNYRKYEDYLKALIEDENEEEDESKPFIEPEELKGALSSLKEFVEGSYFDSADDVVQMMDDYRMPEDFRETYSEIKRLLSAVDKDGLLNLLSNFV